MNHLPEIAIGWWKRNSYGFPRNLSWGFIITLTAETFREIAKYLHVLPTSSRKSLLAWWILFGVIKEQYPKAKKDLNCVAVPKGQSSYAQCKHNLDPIDKENNIRIRK